MLYILLALTLACVVTQNAAQTEVAVRWNQYCDDTLAACMKTYFSGVRNKETTNQYYNCVYKIPCERWSAGIFNKQNILSEIQARREFYDPNGAEWWKNGACSQGLSLMAAVISLFTIHRVLRLTSGS